MQQPSPPPRPENDKNPAPESPDPGAQAPRPAHEDEATASGPGMDRPPQTPPGESAGFDRATLEEERERGDRTLPGS